MTEFHTKIDGSLAKIEALFADMAPEPQKVQLYIHAYIHLYITCIHVHISTHTHTHTQQGKPMPPGMINALLRVPKDAAKCTVDDFVDCFQRMQYTYTHTHVSYDLDFLKYFLAMFYLKILKKLTCSCESIIFFVGDQDAKIDNGCY